MYLNSKQTLNVSFPKQTIWVDAPSPLKILPLPLPLPRSICVPSFLSQGNKK